MKEACLTRIHTRNLNEDHLENTHGAICNYRGCNNNPAVMQFVGALKTSIHNGLAYRGLCRMNCEDDEATLIDKLQLLLRAHYDSSPNSPMSDGKETTDDVSECFHVAEQLQKDIGSIVHAGYMEVYTLTSFSN